MDSMHFISAVADYFDQMIPLASDDELFAAGYLRGHFDLAVGTLEVAGAPFNQQELQAQVEQSLAQAIANGELNSDDQQLVTGLWRQVQQLAA
ncbi:YfcL family protein [Alkalimonas sp. MEB108]|uniref:YfcL family protein n=1 Tax=Alkalimonas cellulosilytica TaxID=3058395 RepID=A0ABU7J2I2_9GAMM|nr:YfcL family protein [Alkalimonas sp. MEB108]MEE2000480.1 YfcL family protein [Alkalimonas sp. MEB108]